MREDVGPPKSIIVASRNNQHVCVLLQAFAKMTCTNFILAIQGYFGRNPGPGSSLRLCCRSRLRSKR
eukprot:909541-Amphidinium_carterae.1